MPLPLPTGVVPGVTNSTECGCAWVDGSRHCEATTIDGNEVLWVNAFPHFDNTGMALVALFQISTFDGWGNVMYFAIDADGVDKQPYREHAFLTGDPLPLIYFGTFIIFGSVTRAAAEPAISAHAADAPPPRHATSGGFGPAPQHQRSPAATSTQLVSHLARGSSLRPTSSSV